MSSASCFFLITPRPPRPTLFPYTTLFRSAARPRRSDRAARRQRQRQDDTGSIAGRTPGAYGRSEEHTSELQSHVNLVCRLLLEKKKRSLAPVRLDWFAGRGIGLVHGHRDP